MAGVHGELPRSCRDQEERPLLVEQDHLSVRVDQVRAGKTVPAPSDLAGPDVVGDELRATDAVDPVP